MPTFTGSVPSAPAFDAPSYTSYSLGAILTGTLVDGEGADYIEILYGAFIIGAGVLTDPTHWICLLQTPLEGAFPIAVRSKNCMGYSPASDPVTMTVSVPESPTITTPSGTTITEDVTVAGTLPGWPGNAQGILNVHIFANDTLMAIVEPDAGTGHWTAAFCLPSISGDYTITAKARNLVGHSVASTSILLTLDLNVGAPEIPIITTAAQSTTAISLAVEGTCDATTLWVVLDFEGEPLVAALVTGTTWSTVVPLVLGANHLTARAIGSAGTSDPSAELILTRVAPTAPPPPEITAEEVQGAASVAITLAEWPTGADSVEIYRRTSTGYDALVGTLTEPDTLEDDNGGLGFDQYTIQRYLALAIGDAPSLPSAEVLVFITNQAKLNHAALIAFFQAILEADTDERLDGFHVKTADMDPDQFDRTIYLLPGLEQPNQRIATGIQETQVGLEIVVLNKAGTVAKAYQVNEQATERILELIDIHYRIGGKAYDTAVSTHNPASAGDGSDPARPVARISIVSKAKYGIESA